MIRAFRNPDYAARNAYTLTAEEFFLQECNRERRYKNIRSSSTLNKAFDCTLFESNYQLNAIKGLPTFNNIDRTYKKKSHSNNARVIFSDVKSVIIVESYKKFNASNTFTHINKHKKGSACCLIY